MVEKLHLFNRNYSPSRKNTDNIENSGLFQNAHNLTNNFAGPGVSLVDQRRKEVTHELWEQAVEHRKRIKNYHYSWLDKDAPGYTKEKILGDIEKTKRYFEDNAALFDSDFKDAFLGLYRRGRAFLSIGPVEAYNITEIKFAGRVFYDFERAVNRVLK